MRVSAKGQVTIPALIRKKMGIIPGSEVEFQEEDQRLYLRKAAFTGRGHALVEQMTGKGSIRMSTDEILALTRGNNGRGERI